MASTATQQALRLIVARRDGYRCHYCGVPTAAQLEHVEPLKRNKRGEKTNDAATSLLPNLRIACPYCNARKGDTPVDVFIAADGWHLEPPADLPATTRDVLATYFGWHKRDGYVLTGTPQARLELRGGNVSALVRASSRDDWHRVKLGQQAHPRVALAAWDFLRRHNAPATPKRQSRQRLRQRRGGIKLLAVP